MDFTMDQYIFCAICRRNFSDSKQIKFLGKISCRRITITAAVVVPMGLNQSAILLDQTNFLIMPKKEMNVEVHTSTGNLVSDVK